ncbi:response regulator [Endozoicomonas ascidiicola]|uniref:response regulator n=1 Tax=Endozoicomonas ascidiicola TaxID=1698521 RepID=UPI000831EBAE|nr:response regulator transcription factor [Endozoicomonas ascidiicola]
MNILLIEDDDLLARGIQNALADVHNSISLATRGRQAIQLIRDPATCPDIIILDLGLPDMDGMDLLRQIKTHQKTSTKIPVLVLTARDRVEDKVLGLDEGADDYLTKPFEVEELMARLRVLERRSKPVLDENIAIGNITLNTASYTISKDGENFSLPRREFSILLTLMENPGRVFSREQLIDRVYEWDEEVCSNSLDVHIHNIRKKTGSDFIRSIRGVGWLVVK